MNEAVYTCLRNANVYMDISEYERAPMVDVYVRAMNDLIPDKVLFASAHPFVELADALDAYTHFDLSEETRRKVMYENARRVLGLDKPRPPLHQNCWGGSSHGTDAVFGWSASGGPPPGLLSAPQWEETPSPPGGPG